MTKEKRWPSVAFFYGYRGKANSRWKFQSCVFLFEPIVVFCANRWGGFAILWLCGLEERQILAAQQTAIDQGRTKTHTQVIG